MHSLRLRLLAWLLVPLVLVGAVAASGAYVFMDERLNTAYDLDLADIARTLVPYLHLRDARVSLELSESADAVLRGDSTDRIYYTVRNAAGAVVAGDAHLAPPPHPPGAGLLFWDDRIDGEPLRVVALAATVEGTPVTVVAGETTHKRRLAANDALLSAIAPTVLLSLAAIVAVVVGVGRGLDPLDALRRELKSRTHLDLRPVEGAHTVEELQPLVQELNQLLGRLREAQSTQARFIANAAHQLRTPVAGLLTQLELAGAGGPEREAHLQSAREGAKRLARLAQQILSLAAADPISNPNATVEPCDLAEIVKARADGWLRTANTRGVELEFDLAEAPLRGDSLLVGELAANLVDNATRYGARNVRIATSRRQDRSILEVIDDGPGIPAAGRERVFERFQSLDRRPREGSGLGLAIVREIAERHGATVEVGEASGGRGARIAVAFP